MRTSAIRLSNLHFLAAGLVLALLMPAASKAQEWQPFVDRERQFSILFPASPEIADTVYVTAKGTKLPARVYSVSAGTARYLLTVVEFTRALDEEAGELAQAARNLMARGIGTDDATAFQDGLIGHHINIVEPVGRRLWAAVHTFEARLYITEGSDGLAAPPPAMFAHSLIITHKDGREINFDGSGCVGN